MFDGHVLINAVGGETVVQAAGATGWNNQRPAAPSRSGGITVQPLYWVER